MTPETATTWVDLLSGGGTGVTLLLFIIAFVWFARQVPGIMKAIVANAVATEHSADTLERAIKVIERLEGKL